jgi:Fe-S cluster assembly ATP-binding protein
MSPLLQIQNLSVSVQEKPILSGLDLIINEGETHVLMGQNGTGKSTLASAIMGNPAFRIDGGKILFHYKENAPAEYLAEPDDITSESPDKRARRGLFLSFQSPEELPGVTLESFIRTSVGAVTGTLPKLFAFRRKLTEALTTLGLTDEYLQRNLNVGFSGGEKKKTEILQLLMINPKLAILDEADSGLDVDAVKIVAEGIKKFRAAGGSLLIITHNGTLLSELDITRVHILSGRKIGRSGGRELMEEIIAEGFAGSVSSVEEVLP